MEKPSPAPHASDAGPNGNEKGRLPSFPQSLWKTLWNVAQEPSACKLSVALPQKRAVARPVALAFTQPAAVFVERLRGQPALQRRTNEIQDHLYDRPSSRMPPAGQSMLDRCQYETPGGLDVVLAQHAISRNNGLLSTWRAFCRYWGLGYPEPGKALRRIFDFGKSDLVAARKLS